MITEEQVETVIGLELSHHLNDPIAGVITIPRDVTIIIKLTNDKELTLPYYRARQICLGDRIEMKKEMRIIGG